MSISLGVLARFSKKDELEATTNGVRALLRRARNAAQEERMSTVVEIDGERSVLRAQTRAAITQFRFEAGGGGAAPASDTSTAPAAGQPAVTTEVAPFDVPGAVGYSMTVEGGELVQGRFGEGVLFERPGAWAWVEDRPALSPIEGVAVEVAVYLGQLEDTLRDRARNDDSRDRERDALRGARAGDPPRERSPRVVDWAKRTKDMPPVFHAARKGKAWSIAVTAEYEVEVGLTGPHPQGGGDVTFLSRTAPDTLRPDRWYRVALVFDGARCRIVVDGIPRAHVPVAGHDVLPARLVRDRSPLSLSDPDPEGGFYGVIDEVKVAAVLDAQRLEVPREVVVVAPEDAVGFDLLGQLDSARHAEAIVIYITDDERAYDLLAPPAASPAQGTVTRAEAERQRAAAGARPYERFVKGLATLDPKRWRAVVIERTGLVR